MEHYRHTQPGTVVRLVLGASVLLMAILSFGLREELVALVILFVCMLLMAVLMWAFGSLTVVVEEDVIRVWFGPGWIGKRIPLQLVHGAMPVRNKWWWGLGLRHYGKGWLWNVSGLDAVELHLDGDRFTRIGTDDRTALAVAIAERIADRGDGDDGDATA